MGKVKSLIEHRQEQLDQSIIDMVEGRLTPEQEEETLGQVLEEAYKQELQEKKLLKGQAFALGVLFGAFCFTLIFTVAMI